MHSTTQIPHPIPTTNNDHHSYDLDSNGNRLNSISTTNNSQDLDENSQILDEFDHGEIAVDNEPDPVSGAGGVSDNNPPESFWVSNNRVTDWLNNHTFIERKASVKLVAVSKKFEPGTRSSQRSVSFNQKPQATIIGFRQKQGHNSDTKSKQNDRQDNLRLFKNRSLPGKSSVLQVTEPRSPRVSCTGRVGSMRGRVRKAGFWKNVKAAILNRVRTNKASKKER